MSEKRLMKKVEVLISENNLRLIKWRAEDKELTELIDRLVQEAYQLSRQEKKA